MKLAYYPGCSLDSTAPEYNVSVRLVAKKVGCELAEIPDWNCCGASSAHNTDKLLALALPARNLALAEEMGHDVLVPCAACYSRFRAVEHAVRGDAALKSRINEAVGRAYEGRVSTLSTLEWLRDKVGVKEVAEKVVNPLSGLKVASYYGCLLVRPAELTGFDDPEHPTSMDELVKAVGATPVEWSFKTECCGAGLATTRPDIGRKLIRDILKDAREKGADCIVTACPLCQMNLDMRQPETERAFNEHFNLPVYYITELIALAMGEDSRTVGLGRHFVEAVSLISEIKSRPPVEDKVKADKPKAAPAEETKEEAKDGGDGFYSLANSILKDEELAKKLAAILEEDSDKAEKLKELMEKGADKAEKVALAYLKKAGVVTGEEGKEQ